MTEDLIKKGNQQAFDLFKRQYGIKNFDILKEKVEGNYYSKEMLSQCNLINIPQAEELLDTCIKIDYINIATYSEDMIAYELEKKNDYLYFSSIILINLWIEDYLPYYLESSSNDKMMSFMKESIWIRITGELQKLGDIYDELEKNYK